MHAPGKAAQGRGEQKQPCPSQEDAFATVKIGEASINRDRHRLGQQIGGKGPAEQMKSAKLSDDRRHCGGDDRAFHRCHEGGHHDGCQHEPSRRFGFDQRGFGELFPGGGLIEQKAPRRSKANRDVYREPSLPNKRASRVSGMHKIWATPRPGAGCATATRLAALGAAIREP